MGHKGVELIINRFLTDEQIVNLSGTMTVTQAYMTGVFCPFCPAYELCANVPACLARTTAKLENLKKQIAGMVN